MDTVRPGDALTITVKVEGYDGEALASETWVEVTGTYPPEGSRDGEATSTAPVLTASSVSTVSAPAEPYEYPR